MDKKKKILVILAVCMASVMLFCFCCFAAISSDFVDSGSGYVLSSTSGSYNVSVIPRSFSCHTPDYNSNVTLYFVNDSDEVYTFTLSSDEGNDCRYLVRDENGDGLGSFQYFSQTPVSVQVPAGYELEFRVANDSSFHRTVFVSVSPDPQYTPSAIDVVLDVVTDFFVSFFTQASAIVTLIVSSWVFLVPVTMMLVVFFVMAIRKIVKGV